MRRQSFKLLPNKTCSIQISGEVYARKNCFTLTYHLLNPDELQVIVPLESANPTFKDSLYETTCFEFFWMWPSSKAGPQLPYVEWNFSPSLNWAVWGFDSYRVKSSLAVDRIFFPPRMQFDGRSMRVQLLARDDNLDLTASSLVNVASVLHLKNQPRIYYSLKKNQGKPDFHETNLFQEFG